MRRSLATAALALASPALAQQPAPNGRQVYERAFFDAYAPSTALQIVERVPGFQLEESDEEVRGFGQAASNVVINGQRPSSKSDTIETVLQRIPASQVARVEVGSGDLFGAEFSGKPQVLNLVLAAGAGLSGTLEATARREFTGAVLPQGSAAALLRRGRSTFNASVTFENDATTEEGFDRVVTLPDRRLTEFRDKTNRIRNPEGSISAAWAHDAGTNRTAHLNVRAEIERFHLSQVNDVFPASGPIRDDRLFQRYFTREFELGGDVTRPFAGGGLKLIGLATRRHRENDDLSFNRVGGAVIGGFAQTLVDDRDETVLRLVWTRPNLGGWSVETGAEGVLNTLTSDVDLFSLAAGGARTRIDLPIDRAKVEEYRGEAFVNAGRPLSPALRVDLGLTYEASRLTVSGDAREKRTLRFLKPKATLDWRPGDGWHAQLAVQRTVAQLQFEDFISVAELTNDRVNGGNADLQPQRAWEVLATVERPILDGGLAKLEVGYNLVSLVQDRVPTPEGFDAPGNLGDGRTFILRGTVDAPLARFGITGGRLSLYGSYVDTKVEDPYTLRDRPFSGNSRFVFETSFRQDLGRFAYGVTFSGNSGSTFYRRNELDNPFSRIPYVTAFAEYRPSAATTLTFGLDNATDAPAFRERTFFVPDRRTDEPSLFELRRRNRHIIPYLTVKHSFG